MARRYFTEEEKEIIAKYYPIKTPAEVAAMLGRSVDVIRGYACSNNISNNRYWTKSDEEYLSEKYGVMSIEGIAKKLGKSTIAVKDKLKRINAGTFLENTDGLCISEVGRLVGKHRTTIMKIWIKKDGLKFYSKSKYIIIREKDLADFMKNNPDRWDATECEAYFFERFDWFRKKRIADRDKMCRRRWGQH